MEIINNKKLLALALLILVLGILFYQFFYKPGQIKKECYSYAYSTPNLGSTEEWIKATNYYYEACLHSKGL